VFVCVFKFWGCRICSSCRREASRSWTKTVSQSRSSWHHRYRLAIMYVLRNFELIYLGDAMQTFGDYGFFDNAPRMATVRAAQTCIVHKISFANYCKATMRSCLKKTPVLARLSAADLSKLEPYVQMKPYSDGERRSGCAHSYACAIGTNHPCASLHAQGK
jgi:hypothetical protein